MNKLYLLFDRSFSSSYFKQIFWLAGFLCLTIIGLIILGVVPSFYQYGKDNNSNGLVLDVILQVVDSRIRSENLSLTYSTIIDIIGLITFNCMLISVVTSMFSRRVALYENGQIHYSLNSHYVIVGYNKLTIPLIRFLHKKNKSSLILIMTSQAVSPIRKILEAELTKKEMKQVLIYSGTQTIYEDIQTLQPEKCLELYILGEGENACDTLNIECFNVLYSVLKTKRLGCRLICYVLFSRTDIYKVVQYVDIDEDIKKYILFIPFTFEDVWAQKVLVQNYIGVPIDSYDGINKQSNKHVHVVINGMTPMGIAVAIQTARVAHFPNVNTGDINTLTHITFLDSDAYKKMCEFKNRYSTLFDMSYSLFWNSMAERNNAWYNPIYDSENIKYLSPNFIDVCWEFIEGDISDVTLCDYLNEIASDDNAYISIFNCKQDCEHNLIDAMNMPDIVYKSSNILQIFVQQDVSASIVNMLSSTSNSKFKKLYPFGMLNDVFQTDLMFDYYAKMVNAQYFKIKDLSDQDEIDKAWNSLSVANKWANINNANMNPFRLRSIGYNKNMSKEELQKLIDKYIDEMIRVEHNRWNLDKLLSGFRVLTEIESNNARDCSNEKIRLKSSPYYAHLNICSFELLKQIDSEVLQYDINILRAIPEIVYSKITPNK